MHKSRLNLILLGQTEKSFSIPSILYTGVFPPFCFTFVYLCLWPTETMIWPQTRQNSDYSKGLRTNQRVGFKLYELSITDSRWLCYTKLLIVDHLTWPARNPWTGDWWNNWPDQRVDLINKPETEGQTLLLHSHLHLLPFSSRFDLNFYYVNEILRFRLRI